MSDNLPPHDLVAEASVLGSMLVDHAAIPKARLVVNEQDFYRPAHQQVFKAVCWMADNPHRYGKPDLVTLRKALQQRGSLTTVLGKSTEEEAAAYLMDLCQAPDSANVEHYCRIVKDLSRLRETITVAQSAVAAAYESPRDVDDLLTGVAQAFTKLATPPATRAATPSEPLASNLAAAVEGRRMAILWPWPELTRLARPTAPGTVAVLCGDPGSTKSFMLQEAMLFWHSQDVPVAMMHLEKNREYHLRRALAQLAGCGSLTKDEWVRQNPAEAQATMEAHKDMLDSFGHRVWDDPDGAATLASLTQWIRARADEGCRIIGIDPITAAGTSQRSWEDERRFVVACEGMASHAGASIVLVSHPRQAGPGQRPSTDSIAGGRAYGRLVDCVMWLTAHYPPKESTVRTKLGPTFVSHDRTLGLLKTRDGAGVGSTIALSFDSATFGITEHGIIMPKE